MATESTEKKNLSAGKARMESNRIAPRSPDSSRETRSANLTTTFPFSFVRRLEPRRLPLQVGTLRHLHCGTCVSGPVVDMPLWHTNVLTDEPLVLRVTILHAHTQHSRNGNSWRKFLWDC